MWSENSLGFVGGVLEQGGAGQGDHAGGQDGHADELGEDEPAAADASWKASTPTARR